MTRTPTTPTPLPRQRRQTARCHQRPLHPLPEQPRVPRVLPPTVQPLSGHAELDDRALVTLDDAHRLLYGGQTNVARLARDMGLEPDDLKTSFRAYVALTPFDP